MPALAALAVTTLASTPSPTRAFDELVIFGDSLSDTGNAGRFSNGPVWVEGVAAGLHLLLRLPPGTDEAATVEHLARNRIRIRGLDSYRLAPREDEPALVLGYGRLPLASIDSAVEALHEAVDQLTPTE